MAKVRRRLGALILAGAALFATTGATRTVGWNTAFSRGPDGSHVVGNPAAPVRVTVWTGYTCPECARFAVESEAALRLGLISSGKVAVELRHLAATPVDETVALLAECGADGGFFLRHTALLRRQPGWIAPLATASQAQRVRWSSGPPAPRYRAVARDLSLYAVMESLGVQRIEAERCLADPAASARINAQTAAARAQGLDQAPAFAINGVVQPGVRTWAQLRTRIDESL